uniref:Arf-GAP domain-containing protein n=1 Tax=Leptobrachium leishanense TaxID=445787 RepID=A0A8C5MFY0_9ANUR
MAASAKRKQEEKHLKLLREMTSLPHNRKCFDCDQRGPTYANMTAGAFVCTSCSGILRGLNPPHRVKSISMTTFTQQEIEFLQKHGNDVCKQIWLGLFDERSSSVTDFRDQQKVKEFLQEKYEKKRWYVPPKQARVVATVHATISGSSASSASSTPEVKPLKTLLGDSAPSLQLNKGTPSQSPVVSRNQAQQHHQPQEKKPFDLLGDLGADIFATPAPQPSATANFANFANFNSHTAHNSANADFANFDAFGQSSGTSNFGTLPTSSQTPTQHLNTGTNANANFAQFENFPKSSSADFGAFNSNAHSAAAGKAAVNKPSHPSADKYAALADLDSILSSSQGMEVRVYHFFVVPCCNLSCIILGSASTNPFVSASIGSAVNPFQPSGRVPKGEQVDLQICHLSSFGTASLSMPAGFETQAAYSLPTSFSGSFHQPAFPPQTAFPQQNAFSQQPNGNIQGGGFAFFGQAKPMVLPFVQIAAPSVSSNPFMSGYSPCGMPQGREGEGKL